jgi:hypothetical protein
LCGLLCSLFASPSFAISANEAMQFWIERKDADEYNAAKDRQRVAHCSLMVPLPL